MIFRKLFLLLIIFVTSLHADTTEVTTVSASDHSKSRVQLLCEKDNDVLDSIARVIRYDLAFTDQIKVALKTVDAMPDKDQSLKMFNAGVSLCCFLKKEKLSKDRDSKKEMSVGVFLKETSSNSIIYQEVLIVPKKDFIKSGHTVSASLLPILTGEKGVALASIAYCKQVAPKNKVVCVADYACKKERVVVSMNAVNVVPCWHSSKPLLFYTQLAHEANRLMAVDLRTGKNRIIASFAGLNMQPSVSKDGTKVVVCFSRDDTTDLYLYDQNESSENKKRTFRRLTKNGGNNLSPTLLSEGNIIFCSDYETKSPHIYCLNTVTEKTHRLSQSGYCTSPSYCEREHAVIFSKPVNGIFQIFKIVLDENNRRKKEIQLTSNEGDKHNPSVSQCGRYILFSYRCPHTDGRLIKQIAVLNALSGTIRTLTRGHEEKTFPTWRPQVQA